MTAKPPANLVSMLFVLCLLPAACGAPGASSQPADVSTIKNVTVARPAGAELDQLPTISKLPPGACANMNEGKTCSVSPDQAIKWGWGFCESDEATLHAHTPLAKVELLVDGLRIPDSLIFQRNETYDRQQNAYCHTWSIKLSDWSSGTTVRLENRAQAGDLTRQRNFFVINVK